MKSFAYPDDKKLPYLVVLVTSALYLAVFFTFYERLGAGSAALAIFPVIAAGWYFGVRGGLLTAVLSVLASIAIILIRDASHEQVFDDPSDIIGTCILILLGLIIGWLGTTTRERRAALRKLEEYEQERRTYTDFLEQLNSITGRVLEANSLEATLKILVEQAGRLFKADDAYFSLWNEEKRMTIPVAAYGSMSDIYPYVQFQPGDRTITSSVMEAQSPIGIPDIEDSPYISPTVAQIFPNRSMLGLPLIAQHRKLGALLLGYRRSRAFDENDLVHARTTADHVALVLSKSLSLEEERKQVRQLTALHDIAQISIAVDNEDELIQRVTTIIGQNLFADNFGVLLLDEQSGLLQAHPSYRFFSAEERSMTGIAIAQGIVGLVAATGRAQRIGNVRQRKEYLDLDHQTSSELCVPIKFKEHILGVINVESTKRDAFTEDDERLLITMAGQVATAIEQIRRAQAERKWLDQLAHSNDLVYALAQITTHIEKAFSQDDIIQNLGAELSKIDLTCIMSVYNTERDLFTVKYTSLDPPGVETVEDNLGYPFVGYSFPRSKLSPDNLFYPAGLSDPAQEIRPLFERLSNEELLKLLQDVGVGPEAEPLRLPLTFEENLLGILWVWGDRLTHADLPIMSIFAKQIGVSLERARLFQEVQSLALTDPLTGLQNRRSIFEVGRVEFARAQRMKRPFCCMMLDLDRFKPINDEFGHPIGDQVLQEFARRCSNSVREIDMVGRYGGEELIILLPETDLATAVQVAERMCTSIAATPIQTVETEISVTVSIGVAARDENTTDLETLIARADQAMYIAKHKGRNRVAMSK